MSAVAKVDIHREATNWQIYCTDLEGAGRMAIMIPDALNSLRRFFRFAVAVIPP